MNPIQNGCRSALRNTSKTIRIRNASRRAFSQSPACRRGTLPSFLEPSSQKLQGLLSSLNSRILLPAHLNDEQKRLVFKEKNRTRLEAEPISIVLGNVELPLEHLDINRDIPRHKTTLISIINACEESDDYENLVRVMEGCQNAGLNAWSPPLQEKAVRRMCRAGQEHLVLKALQKVQLTGLSLKRPRITWQVLRKFRERAALSDWGKDETKKMFSMVEQVLEMMEWGAHKPPKTLNPEYADLRANPFVIAVPLELAAMRAIKYAGGKDVDGSVAKYALRLMTVLEQESFTSTTLPAIQERGTRLASIDQPQLLSKDTKSYDFRDEICHLVSLEHALRRASEVLGRDMNTNLIVEDVTRKIKEVILEGHKTLQQISEPLDWLVQQVESKCQD